MSTIAEPMKITSPTLHGTIWFTIAVFVSVVAMAFVFKVEVVARGQGKVVPVSRVQVVQPEFDGKIVGIRTANGDRVEQGEVLIEFDATDAVAQVNTINADANRLRIERARLSTLVAGMDTLKSEDSLQKNEVLEAFDLPEFADHPFYAEQRNLLSAEIDDIGAALNQIAKRIEANRQSVSVTAANIERVEASIAIQQERLDVAQDLLDRQISSRASFLDIQEAFTALEKEREVYLRELEQKRTEEGAVRAERRSLFASRRSALLSRRSEIEAQLATLKEQLTTAERRIEASRLRAPMTGIVDQFDVHTIGAVIKSGEDVLRVVPDGQSVEVEALFTNNDIGFLEIGQTANIALDAYPSERFGFVKGKVTSVAADSTEVSEGNWAYTVRVTPDQTALESGTNAFSLRPGMTGSVDVTTDNRRLITYFFAPIVDTIQSALGER